MDPVERKKAAATARAIWRCIVENVKNDHQPLDVAMAQEFKVQLRKPGIPIPIRTAISHMVGRALLHRPPRIYPGSH